MARFGFVGGSYQSESVNADAQRTMNWYPESIESQLGASATAMYPTPGVTAFCTLPNPGVRGILYSQTPAGNRCFAVAYNNFCEVLSNGTYQLIGNVSNASTRPVQMEVNNSNQILVCDGENLFVYYLKGAPGPSGTVSNISSDSPKQFSVQFTGSVPFSNGTKVVFTGLTSSLASLLNGVVVTQFAISQGNPATGVAWYQIDPSGPSLPFTNPEPETGTGAYFNYTGPNFVQVAVGMGPFSQICYLDGYFIALQSNSQNFFVSKVEDGGTWDASMVGEVSVFPDNILGMIQDHEVITFFGVKESVVYYDNGNPLFPFGMVPGSTIDQGAASSPANDNFSMVRINNTVAWLGANEHGRITAWQLSGYTPVRISTHAVENEWRQYPNGGADAVGFGYGENGHIFWQLYFPGANKTWVYDAVTGMWHERGVWNEATGQYTAWDAQCQAYAFGKQLFGSISTGTIWQQDISFPNDASGNPIRRMRRAPHVTSEQEWTFHHKMRLHLETGIGPTPPLVGTAEGNPYLFLEDSTGNTWQVWVFDAGVFGSLSLGQNTGLTLTPYIFLDIAAPSSPPSCYTIGVDTSGNVMLIPPAPPPAPPILSGYVKRVPMMTETSALQTWLSVQYGQVVIEPPFQAVREPLVMLRWSDDGGHGWSNIYTCGAGMAGDYKRRVEWRRLGKSRDRVYEVSVSDPVPWRIMDAYLFATPGFETAERYVKQVAKVT